MKTGGGGGTSKLVRKKDAKPARGISSASAGSVEANKRRKATRGGLLKAAPNGTVPGYTEKEEGKFTGGFHFFQMADTQLGLSESLGPKHIPPEKLWKMELDMVTSAVKSINRLKPAFVVLCGDMVDAWPSEKNSTISSADEHAPPGPGTRSSRNSTHEKKSTSSSSSDRKLDTPSTSAEGANKLKQSTTTTTRREDGGNELPRIISTTEKTKPLSGEAGTTGANTSTTSSRYAPANSTSSASVYCPPVPAGTAGEDGHDEESRNSRKRRFQTATLKEALGKIDQQIPLVCTCGNHDMGNRPNFHSVKQYREEWGYDFYSFWVKGVYCLVLNSQLIKDSTLVPEERKKHEFWFAKEIAGLRRVTVGRGFCAGKAAEAEDGGAPRCLENGGVAAGGENGESGVSGGEDEKKSRLIQSTEDVESLAQPDGADVGLEAAERASNRRVVAEEREQEEEGTFSTVVNNKAFARQFDGTPPAKKPKAVIAFSHISPFMKHFDEPDAYFNWTNQERKPALDALNDCGCTAWFGGHYHRNSVGRYKNIQVVTTGAVGVNIKTKSTGDPLEISGIGEGALDKKTSGLRIVQVSDAGRVTHAWKSIAELEKVKTLGAGS